MRVAGLCLSLALTLLPALPAWSATQCTLTSTPGSPSANSSAFGDDLSFDATGLVECELDGEPTSISVCISAHADEISGSSGFQRNGQNINYTLKINGVVVDETGTQIFSGTVPSDGLELPIQYYVSSLDYAGVADGEYTSSFAWTIYYDPATCS